LYTHPSERTSVAKFGSYDPTGLAVGKTLKMIKTANKESWGISVSEMNMLSYDATDPDNVITRSEA